MNKKTAEGKQMVDVVEVEIDTGAEDMRRWALWLVHRSKVYWGYCALIAVVTGGLLLTREDIYASKEYQGIIFAAIFAAVLPQVAALGMARWGFRRVAVLKRRMVRLDNEGIRIINDQTEVLYRWGKALTLTETRDYLFAAIGRRPIFAVCKDRLAPGTLERMKAFAAERMSAIKSGS